MMIAEERDFRLASHLSFAHRATMGDTPLELGKRKLVVLGLPWDVNTEGLKQYMSKYGTLDDVVVMTERRTGRSRGFGYVTFSTSESAEKVLESEHILNGRLVEVKVATPKEEMKAPSKKITRIFVAKVPSSVTEDAFKRYFETYGEITDVYLPKDHGAKSHRGFGFITFANHESVAKVMAETHELEGATVAVDEATPKDEGSSRNDSYVGKYNDQYYSSTAYGAYSLYMATSRYGNYGMPNFGSYDHDYKSGGVYGGYGPPPSRSFGGAYGVGSRYPDYESPDALASNPKAINRIFVGRLPSEATAEDIEKYFRNFGRILDVYLPKSDMNRKGHRGFCFVTFADEGTAHRVSRRSHELLGHAIAVELADPPNDAGPVDGYMGQSGASLGYSGYMGGGAAYSGSDYKSSFGYDDSWGAGNSGAGSTMASVGVGSFDGSSRTPLRDMRYRPY